MISIATVLATFVAGLGSFLAPCTVPLLPAYLACVSGVSAAELSNPDRHSFRLRLLAGSLLYVAGFTVVFVLLGLSAGGIARVANGAVSGRIVEIVGGVVVILFGLAIIGVVRIGLLERTAGLPAPRAAAPARRASARSWSASSSVSAGRRASGRTSRRRSRSPRSAPTRGRGAPAGRLLARARSPVHRGRRSSGRHCPTSPAASTASPDR